VFDVDEVRYAGEQSGITAPDVFAETVGDEDVGLELAAQADQCPDGCRVRPAGDDADGGACAVQLGNALGVGFAFFAQD